MAFYKLPVGLFDKTRIVKRLKKQLVLLAKCVIMLVAPLPSTVGVCYLWTRLIFNRHLHYPQEMNDLFLLSWFPAALIIYGLVVTFLAFTPVCEKYHKMKYAANAEDIHTFMLLRDERLSPLVHTLVFTISVYTMVPFAGRNYQSVFWGWSCVGSLSYVLTLLLFVASQIDNPCAGLWYIRRIQSDWRTMTFEEYRAKYCRDRQLPYSVSASALPTA